MIRTQIQIDRDQYFKLKKNSNLTGKSIAEQVREGVALYLAKRPAAPAPLMEIAGRFSPQNEADLKAHDREWARAIR